MSEPRQRSVLDGDESKGDGDRSAPDVLARTLDGNREGPLSDELAGHTNERIGNLVMARLFNRKPPTLTIGRYSVLERLGQGGMGTVFAAYDEQLDRKVAIKVISSSQSLGTSASLRLKREAQAMARLSHPNVATVHEVGEADGQVFVAMEFIRGASIDQWIESEPSWREILGAFAQAGRGIIAAHEAGLVHRDLKPQNIMRTEEGRVKVLDFGLARAEQGDEPADSVSAGAEDSGEGTSAFAVDLTRTGAMMGTPAYMAPEQHRGEVADTRTDQYGFCAALYEALYRQLPFDGETMGGLVMNIYEGNLRAPPPDTAVPAWVHRVVVRGLSVRREDRWPSMQVLLHALERDPARTRRRWLALAGLGVAAGLGGFVLSETRRPEEATCPAPQNEREALWSDARRDRITAAFAATGSELAPSTVERISLPIGEYVDAMGQMRSQACEAHRGGSESDRVFDLRSACLDERRAGIDELLGRFEQADVATVEKAVWAVVGLPEVDRCADVEALLASVAPPEDQATAQEVQAQREALASAAALASTGSYDEAIERARAVVQASEALGYEPLVAEAELGLGTVLMESNHDQPAYDSLTRGVTAGLRSRHYEAATEALARRMWVVADPLGRPDEALASEEIAAAMLENLGRPTRLHWLLLNNRAVAQYRAGRPLLAESSYDEALGVLTSDADHEHPVELISTRINLAMLEATSLGRPDVAAMQLRSARAQALELVGPRHPRVAVLTSMLAENLSTAGRPREALVEFETARELVGVTDRYDQLLTLEELARMHGQQRDYAAAYEAASAALRLSEESMPDDYLRSIALLLRGHARIGLGQVEGGVEDLSLAVEQQLARSDAPSIQTAMVRLWAGRGLHQAGRGDEALAQQEQAHEIIVELGSSAVPWLGQRFFYLVDLYIERGAMDRAEALLEQIGRAQDDAKFPGESLPQAWLSHRRGDLALARGRRTEAVAAYERACAGFARITEPQYHRLAQCRMSYARALGSGTKAVALAEQAREAFAGYGEGFRAEREQAEGLLVELGSE